MMFREEIGLHEHARQAHSHIYCTDCRRLFRTQNEWTAVSVSRARQLRSSR